MSYNGSIPLPTAYRSPTPGLLSNQAAAPKPMNDIDSRDVPHKDTFLRIGHQNQPNELAAVPRESEDASEQVLLERNFWDKMPPSEKADIIATVLSQIPLIDNPDALAIIKTVVNHLGAKSQPAITQSVPEATPSMHSNRSAFALSAPRQEKPPHSTKQKSAAPSDDTILRSNRPRASSSAGATIPPSSSSSATAPQNHHLFFTVPRSEMIKGQFVEDGILLVKAKTPLRRALALDHILHNDPEFLAQLREIKNQYPDRSQANLFYEATDRLLDDWIVQGKVEIGDLHLQQNVAQPAQKTFSLPAPSGSSSSSEKRRIATPASLEQTKRVRQEQPEQ